MFPWSLLFPIVFNEHFIYEGPHSMTGHGHCRASSPCVLISSHTHSPPSSALHFTGCSLVHTPSLLGLSLHWLFSRAHSSPLLGFVLSLLPWPCTSLGLCWLVSDGICPLFCSSCLQSIEPVQLTTRVSAWPRCYLLQEAPLDCPRRVDEP